MGTIRHPQPVKLFVGLLTSIPTIWPQVEDRLVEVFGPVHLRSASYPFDLTKYYDGEMGTPIQRRFLGFAELIEPHTIAAVKVRTNQLEADLSAQHTAVRRAVNLDPGYLELGKIILASSKNFYHRILVADGIYAEVTMHFESGTWQSFPWTFPDFRSHRYDDFFTSLRELYHGQLRS